MRNSTPSAARGRKPDHSCIDLTESYSSEDFNEVKVASTNTATANKRKTTGWASLGSSQFKKVKKEEKISKQVSFEKVNSYNGWHELVRTQRY